MSLQEKHRVQLDGIVEKMIQNKEPDDTIRFVVDDFKKKYDIPGPSTTQKQAPTGRLGDGIVRTGKDVLIGAGKGALNTTKNLIGLGEQGLNSFNKMVGAPYFKDAAIDQVIPKSAVTPTNTAQKIGYGVEQVGEFFIPGGAISKGAKVIEAAAGASKFGKLASLGGKVALETGSAAGVTAAQGGNKEDIKNAAMVGGVLPIAGKAVGAVTGPIKKVLSEKLAPRFINSLIKPPAKEFNFGRNPGLGVVKEGVTGNTLEGLQKNITGKKQEIGKQIESVLTSPIARQKVIDVRGLLGTIDEQIQKAVDSGEQGLVTRLIDVKNGLTKSHKLVDGKLVETGEKNLVLSPREAQILKRKIGDDTRWTGQAFDSDVNQARVKLYQAIDQSIDNAVPSVQKLNERYANILSAEKSIEQRLDVLQRQNLSSLPQLGVGLSAGLGSFSIDNEKDVGSALQSGLVGLTAGLGYKAAGSAYLKSRIAKHLGVLNPEEKTWLAKKGIPLLRNIFLGIQSK